MSKFFNFPSFVRRGFRGGRFLENSKISTPPISSPYKGEDIRAKFITALLFFFLSFPSYAATTQEIVQNVQKTYEKAQDVSSQFTQKVKIGSLEREVEKTGKTIFKKPGKFYVEYEGEEGRIYVSDGKTLWIYEKGDTQVDLYPVNSDTLPEEALAFLGGLGNLDAQFKINALTVKQKQKIKPGSTLDWLFLIPKNKKSSLKELILGFDQKSYLVHEAYLTNDSGNVSHYFFKNVQINQKIPDSKFVFQKPKGVREIKN